MKIQLEEQNDSIGRVRLTSRFTPSGFFTRHPELFPKSFIFLRCQTWWVSKYRDVECVHTKRFLSFGFHLWSFPCGALHSGADTFSLKGQLNRDHSFAFQHFLLAFLIHTARKEGRVTRHANLQSNVPHLYKIQERYWPTDNCLSVPQYLTQSVSMLIAKGSSSLTHILPTGRLTPTLFSLFTLSSFLLRLYLCLSLFPGTTHSIGDPGGLRVRLCGFPRATVSRTNSLSPTGSTSIRFWCWAGGCGSCGVRDAPGKSLTVDHPL